jgi:hypothetical protein
MVYDGSTLKFYRDGFLMSQVAATGNLHQNSWNTRIGYYEYQLFNTNFIGYINEVRIWNIVRTQAEIRTNMNTSLPNPITQPGLLAYYTFDDLLNKQGNGSWNGTIGGSATINATNSDCNFIADSCSMLLPVIISKFITNIIDKQINLNWSVENEDGIINYTIERSLTGNSDFTRIGTVTADKLSSYSFVDNTARTNQSYYYRIVTHEKTNAISYSDIRTAKLITGSKLIIIYPNPSKGSISIKMDGYSGKATFTLTNSVGQTLFKQNELIINNNPVPLDLKQPKGIYWLKMETNHEQSVERVMIL